MPILQKELKGSPKSSTTWIRILENGDFEVEYYDYLCDEDSPFSSDYAIKNVVKKGDLPQMRRLLSSYEPLGKALSDEEFLEIVRQTFDNRSAIEDWCKANNIPCEYIYDQFA